MVKSALKAYFFKLVAMIGCNKENKVPNVDLNYYFCVECQTLR